MRVRSKDSSLHRDARAGLWTIGGLAVALLLACLAYAPSLTVPFQFDDVSFVRDNPGLRSLWPPERWIRSHHQETRPLANLTFALNHAWTRAEPWSYHVVSIVLHLACVLLLFVLVRRTLRRLPSPWPSLADAIATSAALFLAVHPAQSETVIYIQGRPGLLAAFFGLAALVAVSGAAPPTGKLSSDGSRRAGAWAALWTLLALLSKESAAIVPALVLLWDIAFVARGRLQDLRGRWLTIHLPQWATLVVLPILFATLRNPHEGVFGTGVADPLRFYLTQPLVMLYYLRLYLWPAGLTIEHGFTLAEPHDARVWLALVGILVYVACAVWTLRRAPWPGFCAAWWLLAVSPTSLVPGREFASERYLAAASPAFAALAAWGVVAGVGAAPVLRRFARPWAGLVVCALLALPLTWQTHERSRTWGSGSALWREAVAARPDNPRAGFQLAWFLWQENRPEEAEREVRRVLALEPGSDRYRNLLARVQLDLGQVDSALVNAGLAAASAPGAAEPQTTHAVALIRLGRAAEALSACERALAAEPDDVLALYYRAQCRAMLGDTAQAYSEGQILERRRPDTGYGPYVLGSLDLASRRDSSAARWLELALRRDAGQVEAMRLLPLAWYRLGRPADAVAGWRRYFSASGAWRTDFFMLYYTALALGELGRHGEAADTLRSVIRIRPDLAPGWVELASALASSPDPAARDTAAARSALAQGERLAGEDPALRVRVAEVRGMLSSASPDSRRK
jgi:tetratricopeptide (TPR) repeat protein